MSTLSLNPVDSRSSIQVGEPTTDAGIFLYFMASSDAVHFSSTDPSLQEFGEITVIGAEPDHKGHQQVIDFTLSL
jgi:hypothetical protein